MPTGNETLVAEFLRDSLLDDGISSNLIGRDPKRKNFISDYPSISDKTKLMFMSHTDVVPVENEEKWKFDPFSGLYMKEEYTVEALMTVKHC